MDINKINLKHEVDSADFKTICLSYANAKRGPNFNAQQLGKDLSSTFGKITRFFVSVFTLSIVDLYEIRGEEAVKSFKISEPTKKEGSHQNKEEFGPLQLKQQKQKEVIEKVQDFPQVQELQQIQPSENVGPNIELRDELKKASDDWKIKALLVNVAKFRNNKKTEFDQAADIFVKHYLGNTAPKDWNQAAKTFYFFLDFSLSESMKKETELMDLEILAKALKSYDKTAELGKILAGENVENFIKHYNLLLEEKIKNSPQSKEVIIDNKLPLTVEGKLVHAFDKLSSFFRGNILKLQKNNPEAFSQQLEIFITHYLEGRTVLTQDQWEETAETFSFFLDFKLIYKIEDTVTLAKALKSFYNTKKLGTYLNELTSKSKTEENFIAFYELMSKPIENKDKALPKEIQDLKNDLNEIKAHPFAMITKLFGFFGAKLPEGEKALNEIHQDLKNHEKTINDSPFGETTSVSMKGILSFLEMRWLGTLFNIISAKSGGKAENSSPFDSVLDILKEAKSDNENNIKNPLCNRLSALVDMLNANPLIFKILTNSFVLNFIKSDNFIAKSIKGCALKIGLKFALKGTGIELDEKTLKLADDFLPIVAKFMRDVVPAMKKNPQLGSYLKVLQEKIVTPLAHDQILDKKPTVDAFIDLVIDVVEDMKKASPEKKIEVKEIEEVPVFATEKDSLRANLIFAFNDLNGLGRSEVKELQEKNIGEFDHQVDIFIEHYLEGKTPKNSQEWEQSAKALSFFIDFARSENKTTGKLGVKDIDIKVLAASLKAYDKTTDLGAFLNETFEPNKYEGDFIKFFKGNELLVQERIKKIVERELRHLNIKEFNVDEALPTLRHSISLSLSDEQSLLSVQDEVITRAALKALVGHLMPKESQTVTEKLSAVKENPFSLISQLFGFLKLNLEEGTEPLEEIFKSLEKHKRTINDSPFGQTTEVAVDMMTALLEMKWLGTIFNLLNASEKKEENIVDKAARPSILKRIFNELTEAQEDNANGTSSTICKGIKALINILIANPIIFKILGSSFVQNFIASEGKLAMAIKKFGLRMAVKFGLEKELGISLDRNTLKLLQEFLPIIAKFTKEVLPAMQKNEKLGGYIELIKEKIYTPFKEGKVKAENPESIEDMVHTFLSLAKLVVADLDVPAK